ncbi:MAG TPA: PAS domain S-box protein, partial [Roseiflexaceae bacterium]|nr:PAS domain S-box protein [Roseiflexaceae bacterium]
MRHPWRSILESLVVTAMIIVIIETVSEYVYFVPIRSPIYFIPIIYFTFARGWQSGVASAVLALTYAIIDQLVRFGDDQLIAFRILIFLVTITVTTLMVARLRQQYDTSLAAQQHAAEQYRLLFEHNPHPMWIYDRETLRLMAVNTAAVQIYGYSHDQFLQLRVVDLYLPEDHADLVRQIRELPGPYRQPGVWTQRTRDGRLIEVEVTTHDIDFQGRSARLALIIDVTVRRRAEADLRMIRLAVERTSDA